MRWPRQTCTQGLVPMVYHLVPRVHAPSRSGLHPFHRVAPGLQPKQWPCADHPCGQVCQCCLLSVPTPTHDPPSGSRHVGISVVGVGLPRTGVGDQAGSREWSLAGRGSTLRASILVAGRRREFRLSRQVCILARGEAPKRGGCGTHSPTPLCGPYGWGGPPIPSENLNYC
jgi:hypothetical protein